jgi:Flp pilus assembly pilin Flp
MLKLYVWLKDLLRGERGQDMVEYALITVVISVAIVTAVILLLQPGFVAWANDLCAEISGSACPAVG